jgi:DNA-binding CsgD family transcriptional regulator
VADLSAVVDKLAFERFVVFGVGGFGHVAIRYAVAHPERVAALVLNTTPVSIARYGQGMAVLAVENWAYFLRRNLPLGLDVRQTNEWLDRWLNPETHEDWKIMAPPSNASNVETELPRLQTPTLVLHSRGSPIFGATESIKLAARIPDARLVMIEGDLMGADASEGLAALDAFLAHLPPAQDNAKFLPPPLPPNEPLSVRELEVLSLLAAGRTNQQIAEALVISESTVTKHVTSILAKTESANRTEAAAYAHRRGLV